MFASNCFKLIFVTSNGLLIDTSNRGRLIANSINVETGVCDRSIHLY